MNRSRNRVTNSLFFLLKKLHIYRNHAYFFTHETRIYLNYGLKQTIINHKMFNEQIIINVFDLSHQGEKVFVRYLFDRMICFIIC
jgi:hypothetical protein